MTRPKNLAFVIFGAYVVLGAGIYVGGRTEVNGLGYVRYENFPPKQSKPASPLFRLSTEIDSGSTVAFLLLTNSL